MAQSKFVSIPLEEYKELLLRDAPSHSDKILSERMLQIIASHMEYDPKESSYSSYLIVPNLKCMESNKVLTEIFTMLKYVEREKFMFIFNTLATQYREKLAEDEKIAHMNAAKEARKDDSN